MITYRILWDHTDSVAPYELTEVPRDHDNPPSARFSTTVARFTTRDEAIDKVEELLQAYIDDRRHLEGKMDDGAKGLEAEWSILEETIQDMQDMLNDEMGKPEDVIRGTAKPVRTN